MDEKDKVAYYVFEFFYTKNDKYAVLAKEWLIKLAKKYHIYLKERKLVKKNNLINAYRCFLKNEEGYSVTIQKLYNAL